MNEQIKEIGASIPPPMSIRIGDHSGACVDAVTVLLKVFKKNVVAETTREDGVVEEAVELNEKVRSCGHRVLTGSNVPLGGAVQF